MSDKIDLVIDRIDDLKDSTSQRLDSIDDNLSEHMRRTDVLEELHKDNQIRIQTLEEPRRAFNYLKRLILYVSVISGSIITIAKLIEMIKG